MKRIEKDKLLHFIAGTYILLFSAMFVAHWAALLIVILIGAGKEIAYDKIMSRGTCEVKDFLYTLAGGILAYLII